MAITALKSLVKFDLNAVNIAVSYLKIRPHLPTKQMCSLLKNSVQSHKHINPRLIANYRRRCSIYHAKNTNTVELKLAQGKSFAPRRLVNELDLKGLHDPMIRYFFCLIY